MQRTLVEINATNIGAKTKRFVTLLRAHLFKNAYGYRATIFAWQFRLAQERTMDTTESKIFEPHNDIDQTLYRIEHVCNLINDLACEAKQDSKFEFPHETLAVIFAWIGDSMADVRAEINELHIQGRPETLPAPR